MQAGIKIQTSKIEIANQLIEHIKSEKLVLHRKINQAEEDLQDVLDDVKRKLKISIYIENSKLFEEMTKVQNELKNETVQACLLYDFQLKRLYRMPAIKK